MSRDIAAAYRSIRQGFSTDRVVADPELRSEFLRQCQSLGLAEDEETLCRRLLNLRKAGKLSGLKSNRTHFDDSEYRFAAEIAVRHLERRYQVTLDDILCSPTYLTDFDEICREMAPGFPRLQYRWAALSLRKSRSISPEIVSHALPSTTVVLVACHGLDPDAIPADSGLYVFIAREQAIYVGEANNLRIRLKKHLDHSDNKQLARYLWDQGTDDLWVEIHTLPGQFPTKVRRSLEVELIRSRRPAFNILGKL